MASFYEMTPELYDETWKYLCHHHHTRVDPKKPLHVRSIYASLALDGWETLHEQTHEPTDSQEILLSHMMHHRDCQSYLHEFVEMLNQQPYSPADALCILYEKYPGLAQLLGVNHQHQKQMLKREPFKSAAKKLVPPGWEGDPLRHFYNLIKSIEIWLYAMYRSIQ